MGQQHANFSRQPRKEGKDECLKQDDEVGEEREEEEEGGGGGGGRKEADDLPPGKGIRV